MIAGLKMLIDDFQIKRLQNFRILNFVSHIIAKKYLSNYVNQLFTPDLMMSIVTVISLRLRSLFAYRYMYCSNIFLEQS